jgi:tRNA (guanine37-N1)-methyltransferase
MRLTIVTLFPEFYDSFRESSIIGRALSRGLAELRFINLRDYSLGKNHRVDDHPIGGGAGLILRMEPLTEALASAKGPKSHVILLSPNGKTYTQDDARRFSQMEDIVLFCGHYEGFDARFEKCVDETISIGDYVLTGGEIAAMAIADSVIRLLPGVIAEDSTKEESFNSSLLEYPQYTYPEDFEGEKIPEILFCGNHDAIDSYHRREALKETIKRRPDLLQNLFYTKTDAENYQRLRNHQDPYTKKELEAMEKGKKFLHGNEK